MKLFFLIIIALACNIKQSVNLSCKVPDSLSSFKDVSQVFMDQTSVGILKVKKVIPGGFQTEIALSEGINIPNDSQLVYIENLIGNSFFEIKKGNSSKNFNDKDEIYFFADYFFHNTKDSSGEKKIDPRKINTPKMVIEQD